MRRAFPVIAAAALALTGCFVPQTLWPQSDAEAGPGAPEGSPAVLAASRDSDYKLALIDAIADSLAKDGIYVERVGIDDLDQREVTDYLAVVVISTCIAWGHDADVRGFLSDNPGEHGRMILVTTSGDGEWMPEDDRAYDAVSSASEFNQLDEVSAQVAAMVRSRL